MQVLVMYYSASGNTKKLAEAVAKGVQEAGGVVTDLEGNPDFFKPPYAVLGSAPGIHALLLEQIRRF